MERIRFGGINLAAKRTGLVGAIATYGSIGEGAVSTTQSTMTCHGILRGSQIQKEDGPRDFIAEGILGMPSDKIARNYLCEKEYRNYFLCLSKS